MKNIIIADISSIKKNGQCFGHYAKVAKMYQRMFFPFSQVKVAGGPIYKNIVSESDLVMLPFDSDVDILASKIYILKSKVKYILNAKKLFEKVEDEVIVCQPYSFMAWMLSIILFGHKKNIYLIEYKNERQGILNQIFFKMAKKHIKGVICPNKEVGMSYDLPFLCVPDYIYCDEEKQNKDCDSIYDVGVIGIMSEGKDIEDVVDSFSGTNTKVLIAGYFSDKDRVEQLVHKKTSNITIVDKYLSEEEYESFFEQVRFVILPYKNYYRYASSGIIFDILFHHRPVIVKKFPNFEFVEEFNVGVVYQESLYELSDSTISKENYEKFSENIDRYLEENRKNIRFLFDFLANNSKE